MKLRTADFRRIAAHMNAALGSNAHVTAAQVRQIASGEDRTESHPVWQKINAEIRREKRRRIK